MEKFYHHWFASDDHMLDLIDELGWSDQVVFQRPYTVMYYEGQFYPFDFDPQGNPVPWAGLGVAQSALRAGGSVLKLTNNWQALEKHTVDAMDAPLGGRLGLRADVGSR